MPYELYDLTPEQKAIALEYCVTEDIGAIARRCFGEFNKEGKYIDGRSTEAKSVKAFLAGESKEVHNVENLPKPTDDIVLTDEMKAMIERLAPQMPREGGSLELARIVWNDKTLTPLHKQSRLVREHMKLVYPEGIGIGDEPVRERAWDPPVTLNELIGLVNTFVLQSSNRKTYNPNTLKPTERRCLESLMVYIRIPRLKYIVSEYERQLDRDLFLSTFIRWTHTKPDLTEIEQDQMISAAAETVTVFQLEREIQDIKRYHDAIMRGEETDEQGRRKRFGMAEIEQINGVRTKHDSSKKRLEALMDKLEESRAKRNKDRQDKYTSILDILDMWTKNSETENGPLRERWLAAGAEEKEEDAKEVERLSAIEEVVAMISGQSKDEARS